MVVLGEEEARSLAAGLEGVPFSVTSMTHKPFRRSPSAPFMTSTLQQEAGRKLRFSSKRAMQIAQRLYEDGWITYMRTDSTTLSSQALDAARAQARALYGPDYVPAQPRRYERKVKNAQEAHEAIRPAGESFRTPDEASRSLSGDEFRLYDLIWKRTVASQMADATGTSAQVRLTGTAVGPEGVGGRQAEFTASGKVIQFPGYLRAYVEGEDDPEAELADREVHLPPMAEGDAASVDDLEPGSHATQPPARYTEASLVKAMEELGVGRPSTYASVIATILDRGYVWKKGTALVPSFTAFAVVGSAGALLRRPGRLWVHRVDGGRPRCHSLRHRGVTALADPVLFRRGGAVHGPGGSRRCTRAGDQRWWRRRSPGGRPCAGPRAQA